MLAKMLRMGPLIVGEFRGGRAETARRFDKSDKNAAPIEFGMYKFNLELLADGSPVMVSVFLDVGIKAEEFAAKVQIKRGDAVAVAVNGAWDHRSDLFVCASAIDQQEVRARKGITLFV